MLDFAAAYEGLTSAGLTEVLLTAMAMAVGFILMALCVYLGTAGIEKLPDRLSVPGIAAWGFLIGIALPFTFHFEPIFFSSVLMAAAVFTRTWLALRCTSRQALGVTVGALIGKLVFLMFFGLFITWTSG